MGVRYQSSLSKGCSSLTPGAYFSRRLVGKSGADHFKRQSGVTTNAKPEAIWLLYIINQKIAGNAFMQSIVYYAAQRLLRHC